MDKKVSNYRSISMIQAGSAFLLAVIVVTSSFTNSLATSVGNRNSPPNIPSNPFPANESTNIPITIQLNWTGGDPDNDTVTYNVFFGTNQTPPQVATNISSTTYDPGILSFSMTYYWRIIAWDNTSNTTSGPLWKFTTRSNNPPNIPSNPSPGNNSVDISVTPILTWVGGDPENDTVKYDVYFGDTTPPVLINHNVSTPSYDPGLLESSTHYYWKIVAWDVFNASSIGPLWNFVTVGAENITVVITKPLPDTLYVNDQPTRNLSGRTIVYGMITITADASSPEGIKQVDFYIDDKKVSSDTSEPYTYIWKPVIQFNGLTLKHTIKVVAIDNDNESATTHINVTKWRFHIVLALIAGATLVSLLIPHTTMKGLVWNLRQDGLGYKFFLLRMHYRTVGFLKHGRGVFTMKRVHVQLAIPPTVIVKLGPPRTLCYLSITFLGGVMHVFQNPPKGMQQNFLPFQGKGMPARGPFGSLMKSMMTNKQ